MSKSVSVSIAEHQESQLKAYAERALRESNSARMPKPRKGRKYCHVCKKTHPMLHQCKVFHGT